MIEEHEAERLLAAVGAVRRGVRRTLGRPFADGALTGAQVELVRLLRREPGLGVADAARTLGVAPNTVSTLVGRLTEAGYVRRDTDPADARAARLWLTEHADAVLRDRRDRRTAAVAEVLTELPAERRADVARSIALLTAVADGLADRAGTEPEEE